MKVTCICDFKRHELEFKLQEMQLKTHNGLISQDETVPILGGGFIKRPLQKLLIELFDADVADSCDLADGGGLMSRSMLSVLCTLRA